MGAKVCGETINDESINDETMNDGKIYQWKCLDDRAAPWFLRQPNFLESSFQINSSSTITTLTGIIINPMKICPQWAKSANVAVKCNLIIWWMMRRWMMERFINGKCLDDRASPWFLRLPNFLESSFQINSSSTTTTLTGIIISPLKICPQWAKPA